MEKRPLLYEEVIENLYRLIDSGKIKPGETFPSERVLIGEWDISRNVLREAFHILEQRGLITSRQGKGRFLRKLPDDQHRDMSESTSKMIERCSLLEIYQVRQMLEAKACGLTALRITDSDVNELEKCYQKVAEQFRQNGTTKGEFEIHKMYLEKCGNEYLKQLCEMARQQVRDMMSSSFREVLGEHDPEETLMAHRMIIDAISKHNMEKAEKLMAAHIQKTIDML
nr:FCD domain-containing protein [uncultured Blautia sp.]